MRRLNSLVNGRFQGVVVDDVRVTFDRRRRSDGQPPEVFDEFPVRDGNVVDHFSGTLEENKIEKKSNENSVWSGQFVSLKLLKIKNVASRKNRHEKIVTKIYFVA